MKKKIAILGSTGSIGTNTLEIIKKNKSIFEISVLAAGSNFNKISKQIKMYKPKNFIISDKLTFKKIQKKFKDISNTNIYNSVENYKTKKKIDITVSAIPGIAGLSPTLYFTKISKKILLANKESIICGWDVINKISKKNNTIIIPIDSEHFSIQRLIENYKPNEIEKIYITASGGPFLRRPIKKFNSIKPKDAIKHPKWKIGNKISIDSATLMNKILELIEAYRIFPFAPNTYKIIIHPQSLVHAIVRFKNGITKLLYHEPNMKIPLANAIFNFKIKTNQFMNNNKLCGLENLTFENVDKRRYPVIKLLPKLNNYPAEGIIINAVNEILIDQFIKKKISFNAISHYLFKVLKDKFYKKYAIKKPVNLKSILLIDEWARNTTLKKLKTKLR